MATTATTVSQLTPPSGQSPQNADEISLRRNLQAAMTHTKLDDNFHNLTTKVNDIATQFNTLIGELSDIAITGNYEDIIDDSGQPSPFSLIPATSQTLGGVKVPDDGNIAITASGDISVDLSSSTAPAGSVSGLGFEIVDGTLQEKPWTWLSAPHNLTEKVEGYTNAHTHPHGMGNPSAWEEIQITGITAGGSALPDQISEVILRFRSNEVGMYALTPQISLICPSGNSANGKIFDRTFNFRLPITDIPMPYIHNTNHGGTASASTMLTGKIVAAFFQSDSNGGTRFPLQLLAYR